MSEGRENGFHRCASKGGQSLEIREAPDFHPRVVSYFVVFPCLLVVRVLDRLIDIFLMADIVADEDDCFCLGFQQAPIDELPTACSFESVLRKDAEVSLF